MSVMRGHLNKAEENFKFYQELVKIMPSQYTAWKITVLFYTALHYIRAYNNFKVPKNRIGFSHEEMIKHADPKNEEAINPLSQKAFDAYYDMYNCSRNARYSGFLDAHNHEMLLSINAQRCFENLEIIKKHLKSNKLPI